MLTSPCSDEEIQLHGDVFLFTTYAKFENKIALGDLLVPCERRMRNELRNYKRFIFIIRHYFSEMVLFVHFCRKFNSLAGFGRLESCQ